MGAATIERVAPQSLFDDLLFATRQGREAIAKAEAQALETLEWLDVPMLRLSRRDNIYNTGRERLPAGTLVHTLRMWAEVPECWYDKVKVHRVSTCVEVPRCPGRSGVVVRAGTPFRWRFEMLGTHAVVGYFGDELVLAAAGTSVAPATTDLFDPSVGWG